LAQPKDAAFEDGLRRLQLGEEHAHDRDTPEKLQQRNAYAEERCAPRTAPDEAVLSRGWFGVLVRAMTRPSPAIDRYNKAPPARPALARSPLLH